VAGDGVPPAEETRMMPVASKTTSISSIYAFWVRPKRIACISDRSMRNPRNKAQYYCFERT
jgi:hypothetical protein